MLREHRWIAKALVQKTVSKTGTIGVYHLAQRVAGRLKNFNPASRILCAGMIAADVGVDKLVGANTVEIGTGWVPVIPIGLHLLGARQVFSFDLTRHLMPDMTLTAMKGLDACLPNLSEISGVPLHVLQDRRSRLLATDFHALARCIGFVYHAPSDVTQSDIAPHSVDLVYSNLVFEHVTRKALAEILAHSRRILKDGCLAWHHVDYSDHYAHTFQGLSMINFLRYSERTWEMLGQSDLHYQNRLRRSDYTAAFKAAGFEVINSVDTFGVSEQSARAAPLAARFKGRPLSDLTCTSSRFVLRAV